MLTDFIHLERYTYYEAGTGFLPSLTAWFGLAYIIAAIAIGCLCGALSLWLVHGLLQKKLGEMKSWLAVGGICLLSGIAIYIGRIMRFNSWDLARRPLHLLQQLAAQLNWRMLVLSLLFALMAFASYFIFYLCCGRPKAKDQ